MSSFDAIFLVDNGSLRPEAWLGLARIAASLSERFGQLVQPASVLHSDRLSPETVGGLTPRTLEQAIHQHCLEGARRFAVIPFFFGPTRALTRFIPERLERLRQSFPSLRVWRAQFLFPGHACDDLRLTHILAQRVRQTLQERNLDQPPVVLVDHGSPEPAVTCVRNYLAGQLSILLRSEVACVGPASMERRPGEIYAFNEPLLSSRLRQPGFNQGDVIVALQFLLPGRHAGPDGDIARICHAAQSACPGLRLHLTGLCGDHPEMLDLLLARARALPQVAAEISAPADPKA